MESKWNLLIGIVAVLLLIVSAINIYTYYRDVKQIQRLQKEKLELEIKILKAKIIKEK